MLALDLDGTLLNAANKVTARTASAIQQVEETGALIALCSGRSTACMMDAERQLGLRQACAILSCNGAAAFDSKRNMLYVDTMSQESVRSVLQVAGQVDRCVNVYDEMSGVIHVRPTQPEHHELVQEYMSRTGGSYNVVESYDEIAHVSPCQLAVLGRDSAQIEACLHAQLSSRHADLKFARYSYFVEVVSKSINKGIGLHRLCRHMGIPITKSVAFGDGSNDLEFVREAGLGVAMRNATPSVKAAAKKITAASHDEDGLALELEQMLRHGLFGPQQI
jgi:Cof subfamily protein (haloacid dehalogenase superfamily)